MRWFLYSVMVLSVLSAGSASAQTGERCLEMQSRLLPGCYSSDAVAQNRCVDRVSDLIDRCFAEEEDLRRRQNAPGSSRQVPQGQRVGTAVSNNAMQSAADLATQCISLTGSWEYRNRCNVTIRVATFAHMPEGWTYFEAPWIRPQSSGVAFLSTQYSGKYYYFACVAEPSRPGACSRTWDCITRQVRNIHDVSTYFRRCNISPPG